MAYIIQYMVTVPSTFTLVYMFTRILGRFPSWSYVFFSNGLKPPLKIAILQGVFTKTLEDKTTKMQTLSSNF